MSWSFKVEAASTTALFVELQKQIYLPDGMADVIVDAAHVLSLPEGAILCAESSGHHGTSDAYGNYKVYTVTPKP